LFEYLWKLFEEVEMDVVKCERCKSLEADLSAANTACGLHIETIRKQDETIASLAEDLRDARQDTLDAKYWMDTYKRELDILKRKQPA